MCYTGLAVVRAPQQQVAPANFFKCCIQSILVLVNGSPVGQALTRRAL